MFKIGIEFYDKLFIILPTDYTYDAVIYIYHCLIINK